MHCVGVDLGNFVESPYPQLYIHINTTHILKIMGSFFIVFVITSDLKQKVNNGKLDMD